jgi:hypothetical protein
MIRPALPVLVILGITVIAAALVAALFVVLPTHSTSRPVSSPGDWVFPVRVDCGNALHRQVPAECVDLVRSNQLLGEGVFAVGGVVGTGLIVAGYLGNRSATTPRLSRPRWRWW